MSEANALTATILAGAAAFAYFYAVFPRRFATAERRQLPRLNWYSPVDRYLKLTTIAIPVLAVQLKPAWLLLLHDSPTLRILGLAIAGVGCALLASAMRTLADQFSPCDSARLPHRLVDTGPYRWVRHPIYTANLLLLAGMAVLSGSAILVFNWLVLLACYNVIARQEEAALAAELPGYREFASARGRFFPRLR